MPNIELVKRVLRDATGPGGAFSQRGLSKAADLDRDAVYDILNGRNKNPTIAALASIAQALGGDLSMFGLSKVFVVSEEQLRAEIEQALPHLPTRADHAEQAEYLAGAVAGALGLPRTLPIAAPEQPSPTGSVEEGGSPDAPTS